MEKLTIILLMFLMFSCQKASQLTPEEVKPLEMNIIVQLYSNYDQTIDTYIEYFYADKSGILELRNSRIKYFNTMIDFHSDDVELITLRIKELESKYLDTEFSILVKVRNTEAELYYNVTVPVNMVTRDAKEDITLNFTVSEKGIVRL